MNAHNYRLIKLVIFIAMLFIFSSCAAGNPRFAYDSLAGFWWGLWHGIIAVISLIVHIFNENVVVYEINNTGGWYDFGFLMGVITIWGGGSKASSKSAERKKKDEEWEGISEKVEQKIMGKMKAWAEAEEGGDADDDWDEISDKFEEKLKRKIREWAEKD